MGKDMNLADLGYMHDYLCERIVVERTGTLILEARSPDIRPHVVLVFQESEHISLRDVFLGNIVSQIVRVELEMVRHSRLCERYTKEIVNALSSSERSALHVWTITSSYGMRGAVLAKSLTIRPRETETHNDEET